MAHSHFLPATAIRLQSLLVVKTLAEAPRSKTTFLGGGPLLPLAFCILGYPLVGWECLRKKRRNGLASSSIHVTTTTPNNEWPKFNEGRDSVSWSSTAARSALSGLIAIVNQFAWLTRVEHCSVSTVTVVGETSHFSFLPLRSHNTVERYRALIRIFPGLRMQLRLVSPTFKIVCLWTLSVYTKHVFYTVCLLLMWLVSCSLTTQYEPQYALPSTQSYTCVDNFVEWHLS